MKALHAQTYDYPKKNKQQIVSDTEIWVLSYYHSSELAGALLMGGWARRVKDDAELRARMTWHCAEEARHAWRWAELIRKLGANPMYMPETYQSHYFAEIGIPKNSLEFLIITHVFEKRVANHFMAHRKKEGTHPLIKSLLTTMIADEGPHLQWVRMMFNKLIKKGNDQDIEKKLKYYETIDKKAYKKEATLFAEHGWTI